MKSDTARVVTAAITALSLTPRACRVETIEAWRKHPHAADIWMEPMRAWLRPDGSLIYFDLGTRSCRPGWWDRLRLRLAIREWKKASRALAKAKRQ